MLTQHIAAPSPAQAASQHSPRGLAAGTKRCQGQKGQPGQQQVRARASDPVRVYSTVLSAQPPPLEWPRTKPCSCPGTREEARTWGVLSLPETSHSEERRWLWRECPALRALRPSAPLPPLERPRRGFACSTSCPCPPRPGDFTRVPTLSHRACSAPSAAVSAHRAGDKATKTKGPFPPNSVTLLTPHLTFCFLKPCQEHFCTPSPGIPGSESCHHTLKRGCTPHILPPTLQGIQGGQWLRQTAGVPQPAPAQSALTLARSSSAAGRRTHLARPAPGKEARGVCPQPGHPGALAGLRPQQPVLPEHRTGRAELEAGTPPWVPLLSAQRKSPGTSFSHRHAPPTPKC